MFNWRTDMISFFHFTFWCL